MRTSMTDQVQEMDLTVRLPTREEANNASEVAAILLKARQENGEVRLPIRNCGQIHFSSAVFSLVIDVLGLIARGDMVRLVPYGLNISVLEAAEILNVTLPELYKFLDDGKIDNEINLYHRTVKLESLMNFKIQFDKERLGALTELARLSQEGEAA